MKDVDHFDKTFFIYTIEAIFLCHSTPPSYIDDKQYFLRITYSYEYLIFSNTNRPIALPECIYPMKKLYPQTTTYTLMHSKKEAINYKLMQLSIVPILLTKMKDIVLNLNN